MKIEKHDSGRAARQILHGMAFDPILANWAASNWPPEGPFGSFAENLVGGWCVDHFREHGGTLRNGLKSRLEDWEDGRAEDDAAVGMVADLVRAVLEDNDRDECGPALLVKLAKKHFDMVKARGLKDGIEADLEAGKVDKAVERITAFSATHAGVSQGIDLFLDEAAVKAAFARETHEVLVEYPGDLGRFFQGCFCRNGFVSWCGAQKSSKSYWLLDVAWRAMLNRKRVGYVQVGDMTEEQVIVRFMERASLTPSWSPTGNWPLEVSWPTSVSFNGGKLHADVTCKAKSFKSQLDGNRAWQACLDVMRDKVKSDKSYFKIQTYPNLGINVLGIKSLIDGWVLGGWSPDVVVLDYADNLSPLDRKREPRDAVNETWKHLRALSMSYPILLVTATQTNAAGFSKKLLDRTNFSEDNRKLSHVTGMVGINVMSEEKELGICRLNWMALRKGVWNSKRPCHVAGCLALAHPSIQSTYPTLKKVREGG